MLTLKFLSSITLSIFVFTVTDHIFTPLNNKHLNWWRTPSLLVECLQPSDNLDLFPDYNTNTNNDNNNNDNDNNDTHNHNSQVQIAQSHHHLDSSENGLDIINSGRDSQRQDQQYPLRRYRQFTAEQCVNIEEELFALPASETTVLADRRPLCVDCCGTNFIKVSQLYDRSSLLFVSFSGYHHRRYEENRTLIDLTNINRLLSTGFGRAIPRLVIRADPRQHDSYSGLIGTGNAAISTVTVAISPPPKDSSAGVIRIPLLSTFGEHSNNIGEIAMLQHKLRTEITELRIVDNDDADGDDKDGKNTKTANLADSTAKWRFHLSNSYLVLCAKSHHTECDVRLFRDHMLECDCDRDTTWFAYLDVAMCLFALIVLIIFSLFDLSKCNSTSSVMVSPNGPGYDVESITVAVSAPQLSYQYHVFYRVGCPTARFDASRSVIDFELLGPDLSPVCGVVRFALPAEPALRTSTTADLQQFICQLFLPAPLPTLRGVRVAHSGGIAGSGIFLFDVLVYFVSGPEVSVSTSASSSFGTSPGSGLQTMNAEKDAAADLDASNEDALYAVKPKVVPLSSIDRRQRLVIFAYILDHISVYQKLSKNSHVTMPPISYPALNDTFVKLCTWLAVAQAIWFTLWLLDRFYLTMEMISLCILASTAISAVLLAELSLIVWLYQSLSLQSSQYRLLHEYLLGGSGGPNRSTNSSDECVGEPNRIRKSKKRRHSKPTSYDIARNSINWCQHINTLVIVPLLYCSIIVFIVLIGWKLYTAIDQRRNRLIKSFYQESIVLLSAVIVWSIGALMRDSVDRWLPWLAPSRSIEESELCSQSNQRAAMLSTDGSIINDHQNYSKTSLSSSSSSSSSSRSDNNNNRTATKCKTNKLAEGSFDMLGGSGASGNGARKTDLKINNALLSPPLYRNI